MTIKMSAHEAANTIRPLLIDKKEDLTPEARHQIAFAANVCAELGLEQTYYNVAKVVKALADEGIEVDVPKYPRGLLDADGNPVLDSAGHQFIFADEEAEAAYNESLKPKEPATHDKQPPEVAGTAAKPLLQTKPKP